MARSSRLTQKELRAINEALEIEDVDGVTDGDYESAKAKIERRINWKAGE